MSIKPEDRCCTLEGPDSHRHNFVQLMDYRNGDNIIPYTCEIVIDSENFPGLVFFCTNCLQYSYRVLPDEEFVEE